MSRSNLTLLLVGGAVAVALVAGAVMMKGPRTTPASAPMTTGGMGGAMGGGPGTPQPPGPAPAGKVWSPEHGHWHDAPMGGGMTATPGAASTPITVTPGAASTPVTITPGATPAPARTMTPQPPGPAPVGKVWSPEHGHWHDAPPGGGGQ